MTHRLYNRSAWKNINLRAANNWYGKNDTLLKASIDWYQEITLNDHEAVVTINYSLDMVHILFADSANMAKIDHATAELSKELSDGL